MIREDLKLEQYERKVTSVERFFAHSPFSIVTLVARIKGHVTEGMLVDAVSKVQQRHPHLRVRIVEKAAGELCFTSHGAGEIPIETVPRASDHHWMDVVKQASQLPFEFDARPPIRFILVQSPDISELIILCHHIICDGLSLAYLARDIMLHLGDPNREIEILPDPLPIAIEGIPAEVSINPVVRFFMNRINRKWEAEKVFFDQEDYRDLTAAYWMNFNHQMLSVELSQAQTLALVARCRQEGVTVNTALTAAFVAAQHLVLAAEAHHSSIAVGANLRDRLGIPVGEVMGFYAGAVNLKYPYDPKLNFWDNARRLHRKLKPRYTNKHLFADFLLWCHLAPGILEAINFKKLGALVPPHFARYEKISAFSQREDVILSLLKRDRMNSLDRIAMGTAVTNLTRLDFPSQYGALELDRLIMNPGGAFPLANVNLVVGVVTAAQKLSLVLEYAEETLDTPTIEQIKDQALGFLLTA